MHAGKGNSPAQQLPKSGESSVFSIKTQQMPLLRDRKSNVLTKEKRMCPSKLFSRGIYFHKFSWKRGTGNFGLVLTALTISGATSLSTRSYRSRCCWQHEDDAYGCTLPHSKRIIPQPRGEYRGPSPRKAGADRRQSGLSS